MTVTFRPPVAPPLEPFGTPVPVGTFVVTRPFGDLSFPQHGPHDGLDVGNGRIHDPIVAMAPGRVTQAEFLASAGGAAVVRIDHGEGWSSGYAHMDRIDVMVGQTVQAGTQVGILGSTGWVSGAHLHFDISLNGQRLDPWPLITAEDDVPLPENRQALVQAEVPIGTGLRRSPIVAADNLIRRTEGPTQVLVAFHVPDQGGYTLPNGTRDNDWTACDDGIGTELFYVATPLLGNFRVTVAGRQYLPLPVAGGFTQAQVDAARAEGQRIGFSQCKTKAIAAAEGIEP